MRRWAMRSRSMVVFAFGVSVAIAACGKNDNPNGNDSGVEDAGIDAGVEDAGVDAGVDAGDPNYTCDVAAQAGCDAGDSCMLYQQPSTVFGSACFAGACDVVAQNCGAGEKCTYVNDGGVALRGCVPDGTAGEGEACTLTPTSNSCQKGLTCREKTFEDGGVGSVCSKFCNSSADCSAGAACFLTLAPQGSSERPLLCERPCSLFAQDCPPTRSCYPGPSAPGCYPTGTIAVGAACTYSDECAPGAACVGQVCVELCVFPAGTPACSSGMCKRLVVPGEPDAGACL